MTPVEPTAGAPRETCSVVCLPLMMFRIQLFFPWSIARDSLITHPSHRFACARFPESDLRSSSAITPTSIGLYRTYGVAGFEGLPPDNVIVGANLQFWPAV